MTSSVALPTSNSSLSLQYERISQLTDMRLSIVDAARRMEWEALVKREDSFSLMQSWDWGAFKETMGWKVWRVAVEERGTLIAGAQLLLKKLPLGLSVGYVPRGPIGKWLDDKVAPLLLRELSRIARENGAIFLKIEPPTRDSSSASALLGRCGFTQSRILNQPKSTLILDISGSEEEILRRMRKKTRQYIHRAEREGITVRVGNTADMPAYYELMRVTGKREQFAPRSRSYYQAEWETFAARDEGVLLLAQRGDELLAARAIYRFGEHAAEFHGGSVPIPGLHPNYLLVWHAIQWAKSHGCRTYDLWGIPNEISEDTNDIALDEVDHDNGLWGVYQFKRGFSTNVVSYIGAYDALFCPPIYSLITNRFLQGDMSDRIMTWMDMIRKPQ